MGLAGRHSPVGTVSGGSENWVQIIDELELSQGPFESGFGVVGLDGDADMAIALRTMVISRTVLLGGSNSKPGRAWCLTAFLLQNLKDAIKISGICTGG